MAIQVMTTTRCLAPRANHHMCGSASRARPSLHSDAAWMAVYPTIRQLYVIERRRLSEVMALMERRHGFKATLQMYKKRFARWGFGKNQRRKLAMTVGSAEKTEGSVDALTETSTQPLANTGAISTTASVSGKSFSVLPGLLSMPLSHARLAQILASVRHWNEGNFERTWTRDSHHKTLLPTRSLTPEKHDSSELYRTFALASKLYSLGEGGLAGRVVRKAFIVLESVLDSKEATLMGYVVRTVFHMAEQRQLGVLRLFLAHSERLSWRKIAGGNDNPLARIFAQLHAAAAYDDDADAGGEEGARGEGYLAEVLERMWRCNIDLLESFLGPHHLSLYDQLISNSSERWMGSRLDEERDRIFATLVALANEAGVELGESGVVEGSAGKPPRPSQGGKVVVGVSISSDFTPGPSLSRSSTSSTTTTSSMSSSSASPSETPEIYKLLLKFIQSRPARPHEAETLAANLMQRPPQSPTFLTSKLAPPTTVQDGLTQATSPLVGTSPFVADAGPTSVTTTARAKTDAYASKILARVCAQRGHWTGAVRHLRDVVALRAAVYGACNPRVVLEMLQLDQVLGQAGRDGWSGGEGLGEMGGMVLGGRDGMDGWEAACFGMGGRDGAEVEAARRSVRAEALRRTEVFVEEVDQSWA